MNSIFFIPSIKYPEGKSVRTQDTIALNATFCSTRSSSKAPSRKKLAAIWEKNFSLHPLLPINWIPGELPEILELPHGDNDPNRLTERKGKNCGIEKEEFFHSALEL
ncbi:hypothetical protein CDAR_100951 [Caerostris darwini]|uniref:Uncharacterized protein n=1 Tax=Caerostris darwini TaxID=1538125 RepID=A0AAV4NHV3_9ARAC|nr:hypothetical protein CDAR_100951 [Caerostris darwini]